MLRPPPRRLVSQPGHDSGSIRVPTLSQLICSYLGPGSTNIFLCLLRVPSSLEVSLRSPFILITGASISLELLAPPAEQCFWRGTSPEGLWRCAVLASWDLYTRPALP